MFSNTCACIKFSDLSNGNHFGPVFCCIIHLLRNFIPPSLVHTNIKICSHEMSSFWPLQTHILTPLLTHTWFTKNLCASLLSSIIWEIVDNVSLNDNSVKNIFSLVVSSSYSPQFNGPRVSFKTILRIYQTPSPEYVNDNGFTMMKKTPTFIETGGPLLNIGAN